MPFLLLVVDEIERRDLPAEFAMLPYVESAYEPVAARGDRAAGMWQLMPDTARAEGLVITADYDGRLDANASTHAALGLVARYEVPTANRTPSLESVRCGRAIRRAFLTEP